MSVTTVRSSQPYALSPAQVLYACNLAMSSIAMSALSYIPPTELNPDLGRFNECMLSCDRINPQILKFMCYALCSWHYR